MAKIRNGYDDILRLFNSDTYKDFFNNKKEEKNGSDKNENRIKYLAFIFNNVYILGLFWTI